MSITALDSIAQDTVCEGRFLGVAVNPHSTTYLEVRMRMIMSNSNAKLVGNWTVTGVTQKAIDSLFDALQRLEPAHPKKLPIDCRGVAAIDSTGQQLLCVWIECAKIRGAQPTLVIPTNNLKYSFQNLGLRCHYTFGSTTEVFAIRKRRFTHENGRDKKDCHAAQYSDSQGKKERPCAIHTTG